MLGFSTCIACKKRTFRTALCEACVTLLQLTVQLQRVAASFQEANSATEDLSKALAEKEAQQQKRYVRLED